MSASYIYPLLIGYACGSIPTAYWLGLVFYKMNIFEHGSKNMGATNVFRVLGKMPFAITLLIDILKGMAAVLITAKLIPTPVALFSAAAAAICGHTLSFWVKFKGGKGVATGLGIFLALTPKASALCLLVFLIVLVLKKMVSLGSISASFSLPFLIYYFQEGGPVYTIWLTAFAALVSAFIIYKHRANIIRIFKGEELALANKSKDEDVDQDVNLDSNNSCEDLEQTALLGKDLEKNGKVGDVKK